MMRRHLKCCMTIITLGWLWMGMATPAESAIQLDSATSNKCSSPCTSLSVSQTIGSGTDRALYITVTWISTSAASVSSVTYNGVAATRVGGVSNATNCGGGGLRCFTDLWRLLAPASGVHNIAVTMSANVTVIVGGIALTGVHQTTPEGTLQSTTGTSASPSLTVSSAATELVVGSLIIQNAGGSIAVTGGASLAYSNFDSGGFVQTGSSYMTGAASTAYGWSYASSQPFAILAVPVKPSTGGGGGSLSETILWNDNSSNETLFRIQWKHSTQPSYADLTTVVAGTQSYVVNYTTETSRCYRVRAENAAGASAWSNELCQ